MLNIIILEDQAEQADRLSHMLKKYAESHEGFAYNLKLYDRSIPFLTEYKCNADLLFLDIQIPDMLGMEAAKRIRQMDNRVMIIFVTMLTQYAIEGYSVGAFDYVLKPVRFEEFSSKMDRVCRMLDSEIIRQWGNLKTYEEKLAPAHFVRCNVSFLVNLKYVRAVNGNTVMVHGHNLPISSKRKEFLMALAQYNGGSRSCPICLSGLSRDAAHCCLSSR